MAQNALNAQTGFIMNKLKDFNGGYYNSYTIGVGMATYTPKIVAVLSEALRSARLIGHHAEATSIYIDFWNTVANTMQLAEGGATGETGNDSDGDGIPFIPEQPEKLAPVFAAEATQELSGPTSIGEDNVTDALPVSYRLD